MIVEPTRDLEISGDDANSTCRAQGACKMMNKDHEQRRSVGVLVERALHQPIGRQELQRARLHFFCLLSFFAFYFAEI